MTAGAVATRKTQRKPAAANGPMLTAVEQMLSELGELDPAQVVHAELARKLASTLDAMRPTVAARMTGQTSGQLLKVLDRLGAQRGDGIVSTSGRRPLKVADSTATTPNLQAGRGQLARDGVTPLADAPLTDEYWYDGFEDSLYAEKIAWIIQQHGRRRGLPIPGTEAYGRAPWAVSPHEWVEDQKQKAASKPFRPLAVLEHGDGPVGNVVALRG